MANQIDTSDLITKATAYGFKNQLKFAGKITQEYSDEFLNKEFTPGDTVKVRMPVRWTVSRGQAYQEQSIQETFVPVTVDQQSHIDMGFSTMQETLDIREIRERYIMPQTEFLANDVDAYAYSATALDVFNAVGSPGVTPTLALTYLQAGVKLTNQAVGKAGRIATLNPLSMATLSVAGATYFAPQGAIAEQYRTGQQSQDTIAIADWNEESNVHSYTTGSFTASTPIVNSANQTGSSLITDGWASSAATLQVGDTFTIGGVYTVNPQSPGVHTGQLQDFVVTAASTSVGVDMTISISPNIIPSGPLQTVTNSPADNAVITVRGATSASSGTMAATVSAQNLIFNKNFATLVTVDLAKPNGGAEVGRISSKQMALAMRLVKQYDIDADKNKTRVDVAYGVKTLQARLAARIYA